MKILVLSLLIICISGNKPECTYRINSNGLDQINSSLGYSPELKSDENVSNLNVIQEYITRWKTSKDFSLYYPTHYLFVSLVYASKNGDTKLMRQFDSLFTPKFIEDNLSKPSVSRLDKVHFAFLASEYLRLSVQHVELRDRNRQSYQVLKTFVLSMWRNEKGNVWDDEICHFKGKRSRVAYLLTHNLPYYKKSYHAAVTDEDLFTMATGASLVGFELRSSTIVSPALVEVVFYFIQTLRQKAVFTEGDKWLLQPGVWSEHSNYLYAGNKWSSPNLKYKKVPNIGWDASHFSRMPGYLYTLSCIFKSKSEVGRFILRLQVGLSQQFMEKVVVKSRRSDNIDLYRFNNFMDGSNGVFRYKYPSKPSGYGPFENYHHIFYGWWSLLGQQPITDMYKNLSHSIPNYFPAESEQKRLAKQIVDICSLR